MDSLATIQSVAAKQFGLDAPDINPDTPIDQLGVDSLGLLELLFELEDRFGVAIPQEDAVQAKTLRELAALIDRLTATPTQPQSS
ncbi:MAG TPA: acyl carrier protein [Gemmatimonadaceae bacterium]|jgi:acyl carrier protein|nr:acyl carrier protein [Gemmatimonadaceae bacterium]